jgi:hypothetical protein
MDVPATVLAILGLPAMPQSEGVPLLVAAPISKDLVSLVVGRMTAKLSDGLVCGYRAGSSSCWARRSMTSTRIAASRRTSRREQAAIVRTLQQRVDAEGMGRCGPGAPPSSDAGR